MNMPKEFDFISIGDTTVDVFLDIDEATVLCEVEPKECRLCINYADKVPVKSVTRIAGVGNAANVAVGASRLGLVTALYTVLGKDDTAKEIAQRLTNEGVAPDYFQFDKTRGSNYSTVLTFKGERTILVYHESRTYFLPAFSKARWVYFTSVASGHEQLHARLPAYIKESGAKLAFNPGTFQLREGLAVLHPLLQLSTVFIVNKQEAQRLVGPHDEMTKLLTLLKNEGPRIVVISDSDAGSYAFDGEHIYFQEIFPAPVIERTGCGDAYASGFVSALAYGHDIPEAMRWGTVNAASVLQKIGAQEGLLRKDALVKILQENNHLQPRTKPYTSK